MAMEELEAIDINQMWNQLQAQAQLFERSRINLREQLQIMEQSLLEAQVRNPAQEQMHLFEYSCTEFQKQFQAIEQLLLKTEALSPTQLKLMLELKFELERLEKLGLQLMRLVNRLRMQLLLFMLVQLPIHMLLSLILLPLIIRASKSLPEEATAELAALRQRLKRSRKNPIYIQLRTALHFLEILWAFYVQIKIENIWLLGKGSTRQGVESLAPIEVSIFGEVETASINIVSLGDIKVGGAVKLEPVDE